MADKSPEFTLIDWSDRNQIFVTLSDGTSTVLCIEDLKAFLVRPEGTKVDEGTARFD